MTDRKMTDAEHNREQQRRAILKLTQAIADGLTKRDFNGAIAIRIPLNRNRLGKIKTILETDD